MRLQGAGRVRLSLFFSPTLPTRRQMCAEAKGTGLRQKWEAMGPGQTALVAALASR